MILQDTSSSTRRSIVLSFANPLRISPLRSHRHSLLTLSFTTHSCFARYYHFLVNMFKSVGGYGPKTPKLTSVSLPDESHVKISTKKQHFKFPSKLMRGSISDPIGRTMTPGPPSSSRAETSASSRTRATSLSSSSTQGAKPTKQLSKDPAESKYSLYDKPSARGGASNLERTEYHAGVNASGSSAKPQRIRLPSLHAGDPVKTRAPVSAASSWQSQPTIPAREDRRPKVVVEAAPLKAEAIALSWPLVEYAEGKRTRYPPIFFDVRCNPNADEWNIRARRQHRGCNTPLTQAEREMPASTHCTITDMLIYFVSPYLIGWPVPVKRNQGIRCIDIFQAIYEKLQGRLTSEDHRRYGEEYIRRCRPAFEQRCREDPGLPGYNERQGMRRVDLLRGKTIFKGLRQSGADWVLYFDD